MLNLIFEMSQENISYEINTFEASGPNTSRDYRKWRRDTLYKFSSRLFTTYAHGLLGFILSESEYALYEPATPFVANTEPLPPGGLALQPIREAYKAEKAAYDQQAWEIRIAAGKIYDAVGSTAQHYLTDDRGMVIRCPKRMLINLDAQYFRVTQHDVEEMHAQLGLPYSSGSEFKSFVNAQRDTHILLLNANQPVAEFLKIRYLVEAVNSIPALQGAIDLYYQNFPNLDAQSFDGITTSLANYIENRREVVSNSAFAGAARVSTLEVEELRREVARLSAQSHAAPKLASSGSPRSRQYCWSHGMTFHSSKECNKKKEGHRDDATEQSKMGGYWYGKT